MRYVACDWGGLRDIPEKKNTHFSVLDLKLKHSLSSLLDIGSHGPAVGDDGSWWSWWQKNSRASCGLSFSFSLSLVFITPEQFCQFDLLFVVAVLDEIVLGHLGPLAQAEQAMRKLITALCRDCNAKKVPHEEWMRRISDCCGEKLLSVIGYRISDTLTWKH